MQNEEIDNDEQVVQNAVDSFHGTDYYESADVKSTRKTKWCNICEGRIPSGSSHLGFRFYGEDSDWPVFVVCNDCENKYRGHLHLIREKGNK